MFSFYTLMMWTETKLSQAINNNIYKNTPITRIELFKNHPMNFHKLPGLNVQLVSWIPHSYKLVPWGDYSINPEHPRTIYHQPNFFCQLETLFCKGYNSLVPRIIFFKDNLMELQNPSGLNVRYEYCIPHFSNMSLWGDSSSDPDHQKKYAINTNLISCKTNWTNMSILSILLKC